MFALVVWDSERQQLFAARDRFGVKPLYYALAPDGRLLVSSEIKALHAGGWSRDPDEVTWATYLASGLYDHDERTFWRGVRKLLPGHLMTWREGKIETRCWYDLARVERSADVRPDNEVREEYLSLLIDSVRLRFRSDVPVGINLSGGLDSSLLLSLVDSTPGPNREVEVFTFITGDDRYDELPWVRQMLQGSPHPLRICELSAGEVPDLVHSVQRHQDEPFGGIPTLAYARVFEEARRRGVIVLLDGQGMDEQWAGYDYYLGGDPRLAGTVQGTREPPVRPSCLTPEFLQLAESFDTPLVFGDPIRDLQYRDIRYTKFPRALRFNDRISMRVGTELREPFLDHRLVELAHRQPLGSKVRGTTGKWLLRQIAADLVPGRIIEAPKRPLQTPQREWLRNALRAWVAECIDEGVVQTPGWLEESKVREEWNRFLDGRSDNSFYVWQWLSLGLLSQNGWSPLGRNRPADARASRLLSVGGREDWN
jgi:asparagine synthase (glutamine-hydrolysing)